MFLWIYMNGIDIKWRRISEIVRYHGKETTEIEIAQFYLIARSQ